MVTWLSLQITDDYGNKCNILSSPYINNCNYSAAYHLLQQIYGDIKPSNSSAAKEENVRAHRVSVAMYTGSCSCLVGSVIYLATISGSTLSQQLLEFDQTEFFPNHNPEAVSMDTTGFIYVPSACQDHHTGIRQILSAWLQRGVTPLEIEVARYGAASVDLEQASLVPSLYHVPRASSYSQAFPPPVWQYTFGQNLHWRYSVPQLLQGLCFHELCGPAVETHPCWRHGLRRQFFSTYSWPEITL